MKSSKVQVQAKNNNMKKKEEKKKDQPRPTDEVDESSWNELVNAQHGVTCVRLMQLFLFVCVYVVVVVCVCVAVLWQALDLLGEVAAKSSYSKVLVGDRSGRLP